MKVPFQEWQNWVKKKHYLMQHPCDFEARFVLDVLSRISIITPDDVIPQYEFRDRSNKLRRIDFVILNEKQGYGLAIELDGLTKIDGYDKFEDLLNRQNDLLKYNEHTISMLFRFANKSWLTNPLDIAKQIEEELQKEQLASIELLKSNQFITESRKAIEQYKSECDKLKAELKSLENDLRQTKSGTISLAKESDLKKLSNELALKESQLQQSMKMRQEAASKLASLQNKLNEERQARMQEQLEKDKKDAERDKDISFLKNRQLEHDKQVRITKLNTYLIVLVLVITSLLCLFFLYERHGDNKSSPPSQINSDTETLSQSSNEDSPNFVQRGMNNAALTDRESGNLPASQTNGTGNEALISTAQAIQYVGKEATVCGLLEEVNSRGEFTYLNFDGKFPDNVFTGTIADATAKEFIGINKRIGERICIRGVIRKFGAKTGISLTNKNQIVR